MRPLCRRFVVGMLVPTLLVMTMGAPSRAAMIDTPTAARTVSGAGDGAAAAAPPRREAIRMQLVAAGLPPAEATARANALTDGELASLARLESAPAGGGIFGVAVFVFAVLVMTDVLGMTRIFPFTRAAR